MRLVRTTVTTPRPADEVYGFLVDFENQARWRFDVLTSELIAGETGEVGARYRQRVKPRRRVQLSEVVLAEARPSSEIAFRTLGPGPVTVSGAWHIRDGSGRTEVVCEVAIAATGPLRLVEPLMGPSLRRIAARYEKALAERLNGH